MITSIATAPVAPDTLKTQLSALPITSNCQKFYNQTRSPEVMLEIRQKGHFCQVINKIIIYKFLKDLTKSRKTVKEQYFLASDLSHHS